MKKVPIKSYSIVIMLCILSQGIAQKESLSPIDDLPLYITPLTSFGQRADWSHDGKRILFIEKTFGDVYEIELKTKKLRPMTHHYFHEGYTRALYLSNGDILLSGARQFNAEDPWPSRSGENAELWILKQDLSGPPVPKGQPFRGRVCGLPGHKRIRFTLEILSQKMVHLVLLGNE